MKKIILIFCLITVYSVSNAQELSGGAKAGINASSILASLGNSSDEVGMLAPTFHIGGYGRVQIAHFFRFQLEVLYSQRGGKFDNLSGNKIIAGNTYDINYTDKLNYLDIPLVFMLHGGMSSFQIGVQPSFLVGQSTEVEGTILDQNSNSVTLEQQFGGDIENFRSYSKNDFSFLFGYLIDLPVGVNVGFRILYSLGNIYDIDRSVIDAYVVDSGNNQDNFDRFYRFDDARNVQAQFSIGYTFKKK
ncbi:PorT family protein [Hyphobacterium sp. CCMP332]|nr:PorT family protein [Hyphobacterium sp. CCMP332]